ncbi:SCO family protein [Flavobacteriaceae bacterium PRS1]|nr:SCO family protein [Flavobacteriaceae bacterium PRS1]
MGIYRIYIILLSFVVLCIVSCNQTSTKQLPVYNPSDFDPELVDRSLLNTSENHTVADFKLINQNGKTITQEDYKNKIYVVDFFFTSCPTICPIMTNNMVKLQDKFINNNEIMFLSLSVTPKIDSVAVLRKYADNKGVIDAKWNITTGDKKHIYELARKSYFAVVEQGDGGLQDFIHTPNFILVDKKKQIRGVYDGTDDSEILRLIDDIKILSN